MARTPTVTRDQVPEPLRAAFDAETASSGGGVATGPRLRHDQQPRDAPTRQPSGRLLADRIHPPPRKSRNWRC